MEGTVFPSSAVADLMKRHFVEARIHTDSQSTLTEEQFATNLATRDEVTGGSLTMPYFVVVDPKTGETVGEHELSGSPASFEGSWMEFLSFAIDESGRQK